MTELFESLAELSGLAESYLWLFALVFIRAGAAVALLPGLGEQFLPQRIKIAAAVCLTLVIVPTQVDITPPPPGLLLPVATEAVAGLVIGAGLRFLILGLQTAGTIAAQSTSLAQMFAGTGPDPQPIISNLLVLAGLAIFMAMGGLGHVVELMIRSYDLIPIGGLPSPGDLAQWGLGRIAAAFALAFSVAAPFVLAALLYNLALGAINRAMPQLMVSFVGAPALTLGGLALLALAAPLMLSVWRDAVLAALANPFGA